MADLSHVIHELQKLSTEAHKLAVALDDAAPIRGNTVPSSSSVPYLIEISLELNKFVKTGEELIIADSSKKL